MQSEEGTASISLFPQDQSISVEWNVSLPENDNRIMGGGYLICCDRENNLYSVTDLSVCEAEEKCYEITHLNNVPLVNGNKYTVQYVQLMNDGSQISSPSPMCKPIARPKAVSIVGLPTIENESTDGATWDVRVVVNNQANAGYLGKPNCFLSFKFCQIHEDEPGLKSGDDPNAGPGVDYTNDIVTRVMPVTVYGSATEYLLEDIPKSHYNLMAVYSNENGPSPVSNMVQVYVYASPNDVLITAQSGHDGELPFDVECSIDNNNAPIYKIVVSLTTMPDDLPVVGQDPIEMLVLSSTNTSNAWSKSGVKVTGNGKFTGLTNKQAYKVTAVGQTQGVSSDVAIGGDRDVMSSGEQTATAVPAKFSLPTVEVNSSGVYPSGKVFSGYTINPSSDNLNTFPNHYYTVSSNSSAEVDPFAVSNTQTLAPAIADINFEDGLVIDVVMKDLVVADSTDTRYVSVNGGLASYWSLPALQNGLWVHETAVSTVPVDILPKLGVEVTSGQDKKLPFTVSCATVFSQNMIVKATIFKKSDDSEGATLDLAYSASSLLANQMGWTVDSDGALTGQGSFSKLSDEVDLVNGNAYYVKVWAIMPDSADPPLQSQFTKSYGVPAKHVDGVVDFSYDGDVATGYSISDPTADTFSSQLYDVAYYTSATNKNANPPVTSFTETKIASGTRTITETIPARLVSGAIIEVQQYDKIRDDLADSWERPKIDHDGSKYFVHTEKFSKELKRYDRPNPIENLQIDLRTPTTLTDLSWTIDCDIDNSPDKFKIELKDASGGLINTYYKELGDEARVDGMTVTYEGAIVLPDYNVEYQLSVTSMKKNRLGNYTLSSDPVTKSGIYKLADLPPPSSYSAAQDGYTNDFILTATAPSAPGYTSIKVYAYVTITHNGSPLSAWDGTQEDLTSGSKTITAASFHDTVSVTFKTEALFEDYPSDSTNNASSSEVSVDPFTITALKYEFSGLTATKVNDSGNYRFTWTPPDSSDKPSGTTLTYAYSYSNDDAVEFTKYSLTIPQTANASFELTMQLDVAQTLTLYLTTSYDNNGEEYSATTTSFTPEYIPIAITSNNWAKNLPSDLEASTGQITSAPTLNASTLYYTNPQYSLSLQKESGNQTQYYSYHGLTSIDKWYTYTLRLRVSAEIVNKGYDNFTVTDDFENTFTWVDVPAVEITAASYNSETDESTLTFNVDPKGDDVNGLFMVVIPSEATSNSIVGIRRPPSAGDVLTAFNQVQGNNLKYVVPYNIFPTNSSNLADVDAVICASNSAGFGYDQNGLI
jgi:hypothetical protein